MKPTVNNQLIDGLKPYFKGIDDPPMGIISTANVSKPPTDAELDSAFGTASDLPDGIIGILDDNGAGSDFYIVATRGSAWLYVSLTKAV